MQLFIHFIVILRIAYKLYAVIFYTQQQENAIPSQKKTAAKAEKEDGTVEAAAKPVKKTSAKKAAETAEAESKPAKKTAKKKTVKQEEAEPAEEKETKPAAKKETKTTAPKKEAPKSTAAPKQSAPKKDTVREEKFKMIHVGDNMPTYLL